MHGWRCNSSLARVRQLETVIDQGSCKVYCLQWDVCKSPGFPSNRVAAGQVDPPAVRMTMVCSLFACCLSASKAFLFLSGAVCWGFSNTYTKEEHLLVFFVASDRRMAGVTRRRLPGARRLRHSAEALVEEAKVEVFSPKQRTCLTQDFHLCARRTFHWLCGAFCSQNQPRVLRKWAMVSYAKDLWRLWKDVTQDWRPGSSWRNDDFLEIDLTSWQQTYAGYGMWSPAEEDSPCWRLNRAEHISARHDQLAFLSRSDLSPKMPSKFSR